MCVGSHGKKAWYLLDTLIQRRGCELVCVLLLRGRHTQLLSAPCDARPGCAQRLHLLRRHPKPHAAPAGTPRALRARRAPRHPPGCLCARFGACVGGSCSRPVAWCCPAAHRYCIVLYLHRLAGRPDPVGGEFCGGTGAYGRNFSAVERHFNLKAGGYPRGTLVGRRYSSVHDQGHVRQCPLPSPLAFLPRAKSKTEHGDWSRA